MTESIDTFPVYNATEQTDAAYKLELPTKGVALSDESRDAVLTLVSDAATNLGTASYGEIVAHVFIDTDTGTVHGFEAVDQFTTDC